MKVLILTGCKTEKSQHNDLKEITTLQKEVQSFLDSYTKEYVRLYTISSEAQWKSNTYIVKEDLETEKLVQQADED
ncbi:MAG: hypothetical protein ACK5HU_07175, partial [Flavobacteriales bacterium]